MLDVLQGFVHELRVAGLPVSMTENLDAMRAVEHVDIDDRETFKAAPRRDAREAPATTEGVRDRLRRLLLAVRAGHTARPTTATRDELRPVAPGEEARAAARWARLSNEELAQMLLQALMNMDREQLRQLAGGRWTASRAWSRAGRSAAPTTCTARCGSWTSKGLTAKMMAQARQARRVGDGELAERLAREEFEGRLEDLKELIEAEIRRRLVADRGVEAMARTLRKPLPEDVDFMHASARRCSQLQRAIYPLTRARGSPSNGAGTGTAAPRLPADDAPLPVVRRRPAEPKFKPPRRRSPRSWSSPTSPGRSRASPASRCSSCTRCASQFSKVRSWVFIDGIDEVTRFFDEESDDIAEAITQVNTEADVVWVDGHSDYGHAFEVFHERHYRRSPRRRRSSCSATPATTTTPRRTWVLGELRKRPPRVLARPEPRGYWDTGDSIISEYGPTATACTSAATCASSRGS